MINWIAEKIMLSNIRKYFPIPLILIGGILADVMRQTEYDDIITIQIIAWTMVIVGVLGLARIVWTRVRWVWGT